MLKGKGRSAARNPPPETSQSVKPFGTAEMNKSSVAATAANTAAAGGALDFLLLARSDLSNIVGQVDELIAQALQQREMSQTGSCTVESFRLALCDMRLSLQAWIPRLQQAFSNASEIEDKLEHAVDPFHDLAELEGGKAVVVGENDNLQALVVSPSPLVSWRGGNCTVDRGRQLFLLTPLPKSRNGTPWLANSRAKASAYGEGKDAPVEVKAGNAPFEFPMSSAIDEEGKSKSNLLFPPLCISNAKQRSRSIFVLASGAKTSQPKKDSSQISDASASEEDAESLASKYQKLLGVQAANGIACRREKANENLDWFLSPLKTCVLMEPTSAKLGVPTPKSICMSTPAVKGFESSIRAGKQAGEWTLKRELWTKFEAVSSAELNFNASLFQKTARKGFLEMLEEASCESTGLEI